LGLVPCDEAFDEAEIESLHLFDAVSSSLDLTQCAAAEVFARINTWNDNPRPYVWTKTADQILESIGNYCRRINDSGH
jgi:hypothetical protein